MQYVLESETLKIAHTSLTAPCCNSLVAEHIDVDERPPLCRHASTYAKINRRHVAEDLRLEKRMLRKVFLYEDMVRTVD